MNFNKRERYLINAALTTKILLLTKIEGDFPEKALLQNLEKKTNKWIWETKGSITDNTGVGEEV